MPTLTSNGNRIVCTSLLAIFLVTLSGCEKALDIKESKTDPVAVFNEAWKLMDEHYSLFLIKGADWTNTYNQYQLQVNNSTTDNSLFTVIDNMFQTLKDGHVTLISPSKVSTYQGFYSGFAANFNYTNVLKTYLKNDYKTSGPFVYKIDSDVGYLYYSSFENNISGDDLDKVISEMANTKGLIIDVRNNSGGSSANADKFFQRFIAEKKLVKYELIKKGAGHDNFFEPVAYYLSPKGNYFGKPVYVLTNRSCFSTCNDFVLYMSELSNVKLVGDQTGGGGGVPYNYLLSNGWKIQYTATVTLSPLKAPVENGIQPTINIGITPIDEMNEKDPILEKAFELLQ